MNKLIKKDEINFATVFHIERDINAPITKIVNEDNLIIFDKQYISSESVKEIYIKLPYFDERIKLFYINSPYFKTAKEFGIRNSLDSQRQTSFLLRSGNNIIIQTANGSDYHKTHECLRRKMNVPTGTRYDLCEGCSPKNHSESKAGIKLLKRGFKFDPNIHKAYLWGHWWPCDFCIENMLNVGINKLYLSKRWTADFLSIDIKV